MSAKRQWARSYRPLPYPIFRPVLCLPPTSSATHTHEELIANQMPSKLPQWQRVSLVTGLLVLAAALGLFAYSSVTRPLTLTVAVGSPDEEVVRRMSAIASGLATTGSNIRLKVIDTGSALEAAKEMAAGRVDLAVVRDDIPDLSDVRTVLLMTHGVALILVQSGSSIDSVPGLKRQDGRRRRRRNQPSHRRRACSRIRVDRQ